MAYQPEVEKLEKQYQTNPDQYFAPLADAYRKAGNLDFALDIVRNGLAKRPNYLSAHIVLGRCLLDQKNDPEAAKVFEQVLVLDAENIIALRYLGEISERSGDSAGAQRWLKRLLDVDPMNDDAVEALKRLEAAAPAAVAAPEPPAAAPEPVAVEEPAPSPVAGLESTGMDASETAAVAPEPAPVPSDTVPNDFGIEQAVSPFEAPEEAVGGDMSAFGMEATEMTFGEDGQPLAGSGAKLDMEQPEAEMVANLDEPPPAPAEVAEPEAPASFEPPMLTLEPPEAPPEAAPSLEEVAEPEPPPPPAAEPVRARRSAPMPAPSFGPTSDLPLIMPDNLEPEPEPAEAAAPVSPSDSVEPEPVITETMAEVYIKQGLYAEAKAVYRKLVQRRPGDSALREKLAALEHQRPTPPRGVPPAPAPVPQSGAKGRFAAAETGGVSARSFFGKVLSSRPGAPPTPPPPPITPGSGSAMDAAFADEPVSTPGAPTRPTSDELSLAAVFGEDAAPAPPPAPAPKASTGPAQPPAPGTPGFSFDEFFGNKPNAGAPPPPAESGSEGDGSSPDDFVSWLKGLKS